MNWGAFALGAVVGAIVVLVIVALLLVLIVVGGDDMWAEPPIEGAVDANA